MKKIKAEVVVVSITALFFAFTAGFFTGRANGNIVVERGASEIAPAVTPFLPPNLEDNTIVVSNNDEAPPDTAANSPDSHYTADGKLRINLATLDELEELPGIGVSLAERIIEYRETSGYFKTISELRNIPGIGDGRFDQLKDYVTVE